MLMHMAGRAPESGSSLLVFFLCFELWPQAQHSFLLGVDIIHTNMLGCMAEGKDGMGTDLQPSSNDAMTHDQHDPPHAMPGLIQGGSSFVLHNNLLPSDSL